MCESNEVPVLTNVSTVFGYQCLANVDRICLDFYLTTGGGASHVITSSNSNLHHNDNDGTHRYSALRAKWGRGVKCLTIGHLTAGRHIIS